MEGCGFRDLHHEFQAAGAEILGVSFDDQAENAAFAADQDLPYRLLSDTDRSLALAYGAAADASAGYPARVTYVIDPAGTIAAVWDQVDPSSHPRAVLDSLRQRY